MKLSQEWTQKSTNRKVNNQRPNFVSKGETKSIHYLVIAPNRWRQSGQKKWLINAKTIFFQTPRLSGKLGNVSQKPIFQIFFNNYDTEEIFKAPFPRFFWTFITLFLFPFLSTWVRVLVIRAWSGYGCVDPTSHLSPSKGVEWEEEEEEEEEAIFSPPPYFSFLSATGIFRRGINFKHPSPPLSSLAQYRRLPYTVNTSFCSCACFRFPSFFHSKFSPSAVRWNAVGGLPWTSYKSFSDREVAGET